MGVSQHVLAKNLIDRTSATYEVWDWIDEHSKLLAEAEEIRAACNGEVTTGGRLSARLDDRD
jgi:hypothetical protein